MIRAIPTKTLIRLRDHLLISGERKSLFSSTTPAEHPLEGDEEAKRFFEAVAETMFLMIASDGKIEESERSVLRGTLRELTANQIRTALIDELLSNLSAQLERDGQQGRLDAVTSTLKAKAEAAEAAFVLAAAVAFADDEIADAENEILNELAERLEITSERAEALLDELEQDSADLVGFWIFC